MEEKLYTLTLTSSECSDIITSLFELMECYKDRPLEDSQKISDLAQKIKAQFFEQGNM